MRKGKNTIGQTGTFHTPFLRKCSEDVFQQTMVIKEEAGRDESREVVGPNQEGNKVQVAGMESV